MKTLRQENLAWKIISYPIHILLRKKCKEKSLKILAMEEMITRATTAGRRSGKSWLNANVFLNSQIEILKAMRFIYLWG
jgi:hypothetical protein